MEAERKGRLGILGGLGPMTTAVFIEMLVEMTDADKDQEHISMVIEHCPEVPDRTAYILGRSDISPVDGMVKAMKRLCRSGADEIAIPCFTAHYFHNKMQEKIPVPIMNGIEETAKALALAGVSSAGVMATDGTVHAGLFKSALEEKGITCVYPDAARQKKVMGLIYENVKAGKPTPPEDFYEIKRHLNVKGAETVILGCTELSVIANDLPDKKGLTDAMRILSACAVRKFGALKREYETLI